MMIPLRYTYRSLLVRKATTAATSLGIGLVVFVLAASLMMSAGVKKTLAAAGRTDVAIVLRKGSDAELGSGVDDPQVGLVRALPGVKKDGNQPIAVGEVVVVIALEKFGANGVANVQVRGVTEGSRKLRAKARIIEGRAATPGSDEVVVGRLLSSACYIPDAFPAALFLAWRHAGDFAAGVSANARVGGDNCHRGAVVGALLGASSPIPRGLVAGLRAHARVEDLFPRSPEDLPA